MVVNVTINKNLFVGIYIPAMFDDSIFPVSYFLRWTLMSFYNYSIDSLINIYLFVPFFSSVFMQKLEPSVFSSSWSSLYYEANGGGKTYFLKISICLCICCDVF